MCDGWLNLLGWKFWNTYVHTFCQNYLKISKCHNQRQQRSVMFLKNVIPYPSLIFTKEDNLKKVDNINMG